MTQQDESGPCKDRRVLWAWLTQLLLGQVASPRSSPESRELKEAPALWRVVDLSLSLPSLPSQASRYDLNGRERGSSGVTSIRASISSPAVAPLGVSRCYSIV